MEITEVKVFTKDAQDKKLKAYVTVTFDNAFVVRNIKIIEGRNGLFVAMPSRKLKSPCPKCSFNNEMRSKYCNQCGSSLPQEQPAAQTASNINAETASARESDHKDIAHPITMEFREYLQKKILQTYEEERAKIGARP